VADFEVRPAELEEKIDYEKSAQENTERLAVAKARAKFEPSSITLGFDTLGEIDGIPFGKPQTKQAARKLLRKLTGKEHTVVSSFCCKTDEQEITGSEIARVKFKNISDEEIEKYVQDNPVENFAGGYAIQGSAKEFVEVVEGEIETVIGFPFVNVQCAIHNVQ